MFSISSRVREMLSEVRLKTPEATKSFRLGEEAFHQMVEDWQASLEKEGIDPAVVCQVTDLLPRILENPAMQRMVGDFPDLAGLFPDLLSVQDALNQVEDELKDPTKLEDLRKWLMSPRSRELWKAALSKG